MQILHEIWLIGNGGLSALSLWTAPRRLQTNFYWKVQTYRIL